MADRDESPELIATFLRDRDCDCPHCGYNLRNSASDRCPECGGAFSLGVVGGKARIGIWFAAIIAIALSTGFALTIAIIGWVGIIRQRPDPELWPDWGIPDWVAVGALTAYAILGLVLIAAAYRMRGWVASRSRSTQRLLVFLVLLGTIASHITLIKSVFEWIPAMDFSEREQAVSAGIRLPAEKWEPTIDPTFAGGDWWASPYAFSIS